MNNNVEQSSRTARVAGGVKFGAPPCVDNYLTRQCDTVINRRGQLGRWPPPIERYDSRLRADLYPYWQDIWLKMPPINEQEEERHSTAVTSPKVSSLKTGMITPFSSSEIFSNCSTESGDVAETLDCSTLPCTLASCQDAFPETSRRSKVKDAEGSCRRTEDNRKLPKLLLYGRLQRHKKRYSSFSEEIKQNSRTCMKVMDCIACVSRQMQLEIAKMFWLQRKRRPMKTEINELQRENVDKSGCRSYNGQLAEVFTTNSTGNRINVEATGKVPAARPTSITSVHCSGSSITSAPARPTCVYQLRERDVQNNCRRHDISLLQNRDMYTSNNYRQFTVPMSEYSSRNY